MTLVRLHSDADLARLAQAWSRVQARRFPGSGKNLDDSLAEELSIELLAADSAVAGAVDSLLGRGATERRYLEAASDNFEDLLTRARARRDPSPDLVSVIEYATELENLRVLALELAG